MTSERLQTKVQSLLDERVGSGAEIGVQVAVIKDGDLVADAVAGLADTRAGAPVTADTLFWVGSTAKGVASSVAHALAERGMLDYDLPLADVWPEFASHGKEKTTVRHVLLHTAGVPGLPPDITVEELCDWEHMCAVIADQAPWWEPGTGFGYHARTFGFLLGEALRRATGRSISTLLRDVVTRPLGIEDDVHFGVPQRLLPRVACQETRGDVAQELPEPGSPLARAMPRGILPDARFANCTDVLTSDIPSEGTMTARGVARMYSALLGHIDGVQLVSPDRLTAMATVTVTEMDRVMGFPSTWAFGYGPHRPGGVPTRPGSAFGMVGMNGTAAYADIDTGVSVAVLRNHFKVGDLTTVTHVDQLVAEAFPA